jgi:hypothetical protein
MALIVQNLTIADINLSGITSTLTVPATTVAGIPGEPVNVTGELHPDLTVDPVHGKTGGLNAAAFTALQVQVGDLLYTWTMGYGEFATGTLKVVVPAQNTQFVVGKDPWDCYSSIKTAVDAAGLVATDATPVRVFVKPGTYTEPVDIDIPANVWIYAEGGSPYYAEYGTGYKTLTTFVIGKFTKTTVGMAGISGIQINGVSTNSLLDSSDGNLIISNAVFENGSSPSMVNISGGTVYFDSSHINSMSDLTALTITGGSVYCEGTRIGSSASNSGTAPAIVTQNAGSVLLQQCSIWGQTLMTGTGTATITKSLLSKNSATLATLDLSAGNTALIESSQIYQNSSGPAFSATGIFKIDALFNRTYGSKIPIPPTGATLYPTYVDLSNCNARTLVYTTDAVLNVITQQKIIIVNQATDVATSINLPAAPLLGEEHIIIDGKPSATARNITVSGNGKNIEGSASVVIAVDRGKLHVVYNGTEWNIISSVLT